MSNTTFTPGERMTKSQAVEAMREGYKVTHDLFSPNEWITLNADGNYQTEDGCIISIRAFWAYRQQTAWEDNWTIFKPS